MAVDLTYDLIVIGAGPGGTAAAIKAARAGYSTLVVERDAVGGTCLNRGCIPTKALLHASGVYREARDASSVGITCNPELSVEGLTSYRYRTVNRLVEGLKASLKASGAGLILGNAEVISAGELIKVRITTADEVIEHEARNLILATGSETYIPDIPGIDLDVVTDSDKILTGTDLPESLVIIGGGVIGMEFASLYTDLGREVTVIEALPRILNNFDKEISRNLQMILKKRGADIHTGSKVTSISKDEDGSAVVAFENDGQQQTVSAAAVLIAVGRRPVIELPEELGIRTDNGRIVTDPAGRTSAGNIYAIGDITAGPQLAHKASFEGENAALHIIGEPVPCVDIRHIPSCVYTSPEIACVGMTESKAEEAGIDYVSARALTSANAKSVITGEDRGFVKILAKREDGVIIGAQLMCANATDMIGELTLAVSSYMTVDSCADLVVRAHPTYEETVGEALRLLRDKL